MTAELSGFKTLVRQGIEVRIGDRLALDMQLELGALEETISVVGESVMPPRKS